MGKPRKQNGIVTLKQMKDYLGIDGDALNELIKGFIGLAKEIVEKTLRFPLANFEDGIPPSVNEAIKFIVASYYTNREQTDVARVEATAGLMLSHVRQAKF